MIKTFFVILILFNVSYSQLYREGTISNNEYWTMMESPVIIKNDLTISTDGVLHIKRGTTVYIEKDKKIIVKGGIKIDGYKDKPVKLIGRSNRRWGGIYFLSSNDSKCYIRSAQIINSEYGIYADNTSFTITNTLFLNNKVAIYLFNDNEMVFYNNVFDSSSFASIYIKDGTPIIMANIFINSANYGILGLKKNFKNIPIIEDNCFYNNANKNVWNIGDNEYGVVADSNSDNIPIDLKNNIISDPIFRYSKSEKIKIKEDLKLAKIDTNVINDKNFIENFLQRKKELRIPQRYTKGKYLLSPYSPCIDKGLIDEKFFDEDSTRNDIGLYGGPYYKE